MYVMTDYPATPRKVLKRAYELGAHADCVAADVDGACDACIDIFNKVFHDTYGHAEDLAEALFLMLEDIRRDREEK